MEKFVLKSGSQFLLFGTELFCILRKKEFEAKGLYGKMSICQVSQWPGLVTCVWFTVLSLKISSLQFWK